MRMNTGGMKMSRFVPSLAKLAMGAVCALTIVTTALAGDFDIPAGDLRAALRSYMAQSGVQLMFSDDAIGDTRSSGAKGSLSADRALTCLLSNTGFTVRRAPSGAIGIVREQSSLEDGGSLRQLAEIAPAKAIETVTVTSSKLGGADVQSIPISITALSQEQLTATQTAGGPDLVKQVPNMTFTKTNFSGYSIQLRGIGTQAISVTTDPAVAVAFNDIPLHSQSFLRTGILRRQPGRGTARPQGTLYGRNATAGVVNLDSAKPTDQFEAMASADIGNYQNRRLEAMINFRSSMIA